MRVRINESGEDVFPGCIDDFRAAWRRDVFVDSRDALAFAEDVGGVTGVLSALVWLVAVAYPYIKKLLNA